MGVESWTPVPLILALGKGGCVELPSARGLAGGLGGGPPKPCRAPGRGAGTLASVATKL